MKNGLARFEHHLQKLETLTKQARNEQNPALWLYTNDARTPLFMLEGLSRLYEGLHNKKKFSRIKDWFKLLEDSIGQVDYYSSYAKIFMEHPTVPVHLREYMQAQTREKLQRLNDLLASKSWVGEKPQRFSKIRKKIKNADWLNPKDEAKAIMDFYKKDIEGIQKFTKEFKGGFTEMEAQVHELRRNLRWLSIYPQALQGLIQLADSGQEDAATKKYLVTEIVESKFNVMPDAGSNNWFVLLEKNHFYALSWMIAETGKIKDDGLEIFAVTEALMQTEGLSHEVAYHRSFETLGLPADKIQQLLQRASQITNTFMEEKQLEQLPYSLAKTTK
jgi:hypothetical protein